MNILSSLIAALVVSHLSVALAQTYYPASSGGSYNACRPCPTCDDAVRGVTPGSPGADQPPAVPGTNPDAGTNPANSLASNDNSGTASASNSGYSGMIGDFFVGRGVSSSNLAIAGGDAHAAKIADNSSPMPIDRVFFDYNYFSGALTSGANTIPLKRYVFGAEQTFWNGCGSVEIRVPFAEGLSANDPGATQPEGTEFGNISLTTKFVIDQCDDYLVSAGLEMVIPTARGSTAGASTFTNDAFHLMPYVGAMWKPTCDFYSIAYAQMDFDTGGIGDTEGGGAHFQLQDQTLLYLDINAGYWFYRNPCADYVKAAAAIVELHYTTTTTDADAPAGSYFGGEGPDRHDILDFTYGINFKGERSMLTVGSSIPLNSGDNRTFHTEALVQFNYFR